MTTRAVVFGATGVLGGAVSSALSQAGFDVVRAVRTVIGDNEVHADLDEDASVAAAIEGSGVVVNAVPHSACAPERLVLRDGGLLLNISGVSSAVRARLENEPGARRGCVVMHGGLVPGVSSLVARTLVERRPQTDRIEVAMMFSTHGSSGRTGGVFAFDALTARAHLPTQRVDFGTDLGTRRAFTVLPEERAWLGAISKGRTCRVHVAFAESSLQRLLGSVNSLHAMRLLPRAAFARGNQPNGELSREHIAEWVGAFSGESALDSCLIDCCGDYRTTAAAAVAEVRALVGLRQGRQAGVFTIEEVLTLADVQSELTAAGVRLVWS
jgi:hypothetical protein